MTPSTEAIGYANYIVNNFFIKDNTYLDSNYLSICVKLVHREGEPPLTKQVIDNNVINIKKSDLTIFNNYRIPGFINPYDMGNVIDVNQDGDITKYWVSLDSGRSLIIKQITDKNGFIHSKVSLIKDGAVVIKATDVQTSPNSFTRSIKVGDITKVWVYDMLGNKILKYNDINTKFMESSNPDDSVSDKIIAYDIETTHYPKGVDAWTIS